MNYFNPKIKQVFIQGFALRRNVLIISHYLQKFNAVKYSYMYKTILQYALKCFYLVPICLHR